MCDALFWPGKKCRRNTIQHSFVYSIVWTNTIDCKIILNGFWNWIRLDKLEEWVSGGDFASLTYDSCHKYIFNLSSSDSLKFLIRQNRIPFDRCRILLLKTRKFITRKKKIIDFITSMHDDWLHWSSCNLVKYYDRRMGFHSVLALWFSSWI